MRRAMPSDRDDILALIRKFGNSATADQIEPEFNRFWAETDSLFEVFLNNNGMVIAFLYGTRHELVELSANPNFLKTELKTVLYEALKEWGAKADQGRLLTQPRLISGDWKTFFKKQGAKIESQKTADGQRDCIQFD